MATSDNDEYRISFVYHDTTETVFDLKLLADYCNTLPEDSCPEIKLLC
jgi:hypothetical protein